MPIRRQVPYPRPTPSSPVPGPSSGIYRPILRRVPLRPIRLPYSQSDFEIYENEVEEDELLRGFQ